MCAGLDGYIATYGLEPDMPTIGADRERDPGRANAWGAPASPNRVGRPCLY
jgi:hypothetical protein